MAAEKAKMLAKLGWIGLVIAALALLVGGLIAAANAESQATIEYKASIETLKELKTSLEDAKSAAEDLQSAFDTYDSIIDTLDSCVQGTEEWTKALRENRSHVLDLISKYPQLLTMMDSSGHKAITLGEDGVYRIADWA
jgi:septal ring factor EnvC (AmiA/AmiB activator)